MTYITRTLPPFCLLSLLVALAGCGGSSGGSGDATGRVTGRITLGTGAGRAAADTITVRVEGTSLSAIAGADGRFTLEGVPIGLHTLTARTVSKAVAFTAEVGAGGATDVGELSLRDAGQISGLVTSAETREPIHGAQITVTEMVLTNTDEEQPHPVRLAESNAAGSYSIPGLPVGDYLVTVDKEGYESASLVVAVFASTTTPADAALAPSAPTEKGAMSGTAYLVTDEGEKQPLAGVLVRLARTDDPQPLRPLPEKANVPGGAAVDLYSSNGSPRGDDHHGFYHEYYTFTDEQGAYTLDGIPAGQYVAVAVRPGLEADRKPVTIDAANPAHVDFELKLRRPRIGIIEGLVTSAATGQPIAGASVSVIFRPIPMPSPDYGQRAGAAGANRGASAEGGSGHAGRPGVFIPPDDYILYTTTEADGRYKLRVPAGDTSIIVSAEGYAYKEVEAHVEAGATVTVDIALEVHETHAVTLSGRVVAADEQGALAPVAGAAVYAAGGDDHGYASPSRMHPALVHQTETNEAGEYKLALTSGAYSLYASKDHLASEPVRMDIEKDTELELVLKPIPEPTEPPQKQ